MTGLGKQAKTISDIQLRTLLRHVEAETGFPERNRVIVFSSFRAGLRSKEIAGVRWSMVTDTEGNVSDSLALTNGCAARKLDQYAAREVGHLKDVYSTRIVTRSPQRH